MQANFLQALLVTNAAKIASKHAIHNLCVDNARGYRLRGEVSLMIEEFDKADKALKQLSRLHAAQKALYTELKAGYRNTRIHKKAGKLHAAGVEIVIQSDWTSFEVEKEVDRLMGVHFRAESLKKAA